MTICHIAPPPTMGRTATPTIDELFRYQIALTPVIASRHNTSGDPSPLKSASPPTVQFVPGTVGIATLPITVPAPFRYHNALLPVTVSRHSTSTWPSALKSAVPAITQLAP